MPLIRPLAAVAALLLLAVVPGRPAHAQATFAGIVRTDSGRTLLADVAVILPALRREARTDANGRFRLEGLRPGLTEIVVRAVGLAPRRDTVTLAASGAVERDYVLARVPAELDPVAVRADARPRSPGLRGFEERRGQGFGRFVDEATLREQDGRTLAAVVADRIPGLRIVRIGSDQFAVSTRSLSGPSGRAIPRTTAEMGQCYPDVYLDGVPVYGGAGGGERFDLARWSTRDFAGIEFYAGGGSVPLQFNRTSTGCGVLVLWTRER